MAGDHLRADEGLERAGDGRSEAAWVDIHSADDESLADVGAALLLDDLDELAFQPPMGSRIGELQDLAHPVIETLRAAIEQHQRGVAGHELEVMGSEGQTSEIQSLM